MNKKLSTSQQIFNPGPANFYKKTFKKVYIISRIIFFIIFILACIAIGFIINEFLNTHTFVWQEPVIVRTPLVIERIKEIQIVATGSAQTKDYKPTSLIPTAYAHGEVVKEARAIEQAKNAAIVWRIYMLESTFGKGDGCRIKGKYNGFGFGQPDSKMADGTGACFDSFEDVVKAVDKWLDEKLATMELPSALCLYNTGTPTTDCTYFQNYLKTI